MRTPEFVPRALFDLESIVTYISVVLHAPQAAASWRAKFVDAINLLCHQPELGRRFFDDSLQVKLRRTYLVGNYKIFYSYDDETLTVWRVIHTSQNMDEYALVDF